MTGSAVRSWLVQADGEHKEPDRGLPDLQFMSRRRLGPAFGFDDTTRHYQLSRELAVSWILMHVNGVGSCNFPNPRLEAYAPA